MNDSSPHQDGGESMINLTQLKFNQSFKLLTEKYGDKGKDILQDVQNLLITMSDDEAKGYSDTLHPRAHSISHSPKSPRGSIPKGPTEQDVIRLQGIIRRWLRRRWSQRVIPSIAMALLASPMSDYQRKRNEIWRNLLMNQRDYFTGLFFIVEHKHDDILSKKALNKIFMNVVDIKDHAKLVLKKFEDTAKDWPSSTKVGTIFKEMVAYFYSHYVPYTEGYCKSLRTLIKQRKTNSAFRKFLADIDTKESTLASSMLMPVSKLVQYQWSIKALLDLTPHEHVDFGDLNDTLSELEALNHKLKPTRNAAEKLAKIEAIQYAMKGTPTTTLLDGHSSLVREGPLKLVTVSGLENCYVYVFSDAILIGEICIDGERKFKKIVHLDNAKVVEVQNSDYQENCFDIKTRWKTKHRFSAATPEEQKSYINDLASIITALSKSPATSPAQAKEKPHKNLIPHQLHIPLDVLLFSKKVVEKDKDEKDLEKKRAAKRGISTTFEWSVENNHDEHFLDGILAQLPTGIVLLKPVEETKDDQTPLIRRDGPETGSASDDDFNDFGLDNPELLSCKSVSTYPLKNGGNGVREGDPIADHYHIQCFKHKTFIALTDGCNWGVAPQQAAIKASRKFVQYIIHETQGHPTLKMKQFGSVLFDAASEAHSSIIAGLANKDVWSAGTTTILAGVILKVIPDRDKTLKAEMGQWAFIYLSIGDCKAYHIAKDTKVITDVTAGNRISATDVSDPGGRLGPTTGGGAPDLRNLRLGFYPCNSGDILVLCSDGVHDNLDPQMLGLAPKDLDPRLEASWKDLDSMVAHQLKTNYRTQLMSKLLSEGCPDGVITPEKVTNILIHHSVETTKKVRDFMESTVNVRQPKDRTAYPGKVDHTTCVSVRVGSIMSSSPSSIQYSSNANPLLASSPGVRPSSPVAFNPISSYPPPSILQAPTPNVISSSTPNTSPINTL